MLIFLLYFSSYDISEYFSTAIFELDETYPSTSSWIWGVQV